MAGKNLRRELAKALAPLEDIGTAPKLRRENTDLRRQLAAAEDVARRLLTARRCGVCGLTCEIPHKAFSMELSEGRIAWFHDASEEDCWERLKRFVLALEARRSLLAPEGGPVAGGGETPC